MRSLSPTPTSGSGEARNNRAPRRSAARLVVVRHEGAPSGQRTRPRMTRSPAKHMELSGEGHVESRPCGNALNPWSFPPGTHPSLPRPPGRGNVQDTRTPVRCMDESGDIAACPEPPAHPAANLVSHGNAVAIELGGHVELQEGLTLLPWQLGNGARCPPSCHLARAAHDSHAPALCCQHPSWAKAFVDGSYQLTPRIACTLQSRPRAHSPHEVNSSRHKHAPFPNAAKPDPLPETQ